ncbi:solute carrier family 12 [Anaeramoeba ignava]|uniref:Solute carrier family 12 n=1 Tax=Anaeramoeba ignava TaxID=1746090 RepID=A0A9Q0RHS3_ANAIG|nr:solute carrier family 12 [Anaeramoeba ignava]
MKKRNEKEEKTNNDMEIETSPLVKNKSKPTKNKLTTFGGVYSTVLESIVSLIYFLRFGWVLGESGLLEMFAMLALAYIVVGFTVLSISAIATNGRMGVGGAYYMVSRSLGPEFGGAVGILFFFANITASALYCLGFTEAFMDLFGWDQSNSKHVLLISSIVLFVKFCLSLIGARMFSRAIIFLLFPLTISVSVSMISLFFRKPHSISGYSGWSLETFKHNILPDYVPDPLHVMKTVNFRTVFGIFFPSLTGILAGTNMSGDLKNPGKSIPKGTLLALLTAAILYFILIFQLAFTIERSELQQNYFILSHDCLIPYVVRIGILSVTFSSGLGALIGSSRILQSLASDNLIPILSFFKKGSIKGNEPRRAVIFGWIIAQLLLFMGNINIIAPYTSQFFLATYGIINFACFIHHSLGAPNFRPMFKKFNSITALIGALICFAAMFFVGYITAIVAFVVLALVIIYINYKGTPSPWGYISQSLIFHQVRKYMLKMDMKKEHIKFWRPQFLLLIDQPHLPLPLLDFINNLKKGGLYIIGNIFHSSFDEDKTIQGLQSRRSALYEVIKLTKIKAFPQVLFSQNFRAGAQSLMLSSGIGEMKPNTIILDIPNSSTLIEDITLIDSDELDINDIEQNKSQKKNMNKGQSEHISINDESPYKFKSKKEKKQFYIQSQLDKLIEIFETSDEREEDESVNYYYYSMIDAKKIGMNIILTTNFNRLDKNEIVKFSKKKQGKKTIDIWLLNFPYSGFFNSISQNYEEDDVDIISQLSDSTSISLLFGYIIHQTNIWKKHTTIRLLAFAQNEGMKLETKKFLKFILFSLRIEAKVKVIIPENGINEIFTEDEKSEGNNQEKYFSNQNLSNEKVNQLILQQSKETCLIFIPLEEIIPEIIKEVQAISNNLPPITFFHASTKVVTNEI